jgi:hypothetical protein
LFLGACWLGVAVDPTGEEFTELHNLGGGS